MQERSTQISDLARTTTCRTFSFILIVSNIFSLLISSLFFKRRKKLSAEQQLSQISKVAEAQQYISQAVNNLAQKVDFPILNQLASDSFQFSVSQVLRTIEEIQMWQTEQIEILKIIASSQPKDRREVDESIEKIEKVQEEEQQKSSQIREVLQQAHRKLHSPSNKFYNVFFFFDFYLKLRSFIKIECTF